MLNKIEIENLENNPRLGKVLDTYSMIKKIKPKKYIKSIVNFIIFVVSLSLFACSSIYYSFYYDNIYSVLNGIIIGVISFSLFYSIHFIYLDLKNYFLFKKINKIINFEIEGNYYSKRNVKKIDKFLKISDFKSIFILKTILKLNTDNIVCLKYYLKNK